MLVWLSNKEKPFSTLSLSLNHLNIRMRERMWFIVLVAIPVTSATLVRLSNFSPLEDTSTNMQLDVSRKPMVLHSTFSRTKTHTLDWDNRVFLDFEPHWRKREIKEALFIDCLNPVVTMMPRMLMNLEKGIEIASCWKEFNPHIREILSKQYTREKPTKK